MLCGDEVKAAVIDIGNTATHTRIFFFYISIIPYAITLTYSLLGASTCRFGFAGQNFPIHTFKTNVGVSQDNSCGSTDSTASKQGSGCKYSLGDNSLRFLNDYMNISHPCGDDGAINWDIMESIFSYGIHDRMQIDPQEYPFLIAEGFFNNNLSKSKLMEMCFESFDSPAMYTSANAVLSSFSAGKPTALVVDFGAISTRITPVLDGYAIRKGTFATSRGGNWMDSIVKEELVQHGISINPWYETVNNNSNSSKIKPRESFRELHVNDLIKDIKKWFCFIPYTPMAAETREDRIKALQMPPYELPDGAVLNHFDSMCTVAERLFLPFDRTSGNAEVRMGVPPHLQDCNINIQVDSDSIQQLAYHAVASCDVDCRKDLLANIILTGGGAAIDGVTNRFQHELSALLPPTYKVKIASQIPLEKHNSVWIGGSILGICGSFQQLWVSKSEYQEYGANALIDSRLVH